MGRIFYWLLFFYSTVAFLLGGVAKWPKTQEAGAIVLTVLLVGAFLKKLTRDVRAYRRSH